MSDDLVGLLTEVPSRLVDDAPIEWPRVRDGLWERVLGGVRAGETGAFWDAARDAHGKWRDGYWSPTTRPRAAAELEAAGELIRAGAAAAGAPAGAGARRLWTRAVLEALGREAAVPFRVEVPVALVRPTDPMAAFIATLELSFLEGGTGELAPHPRAAFTFVGQELSESLESAWAAARSDTGKRETDCLWRLARRGDAVQEADGASLGLSALAGFHHGLRRRHPDQGVIFMAAIRTDGASLSVTPLGPTSIEEKCRSLARTVAASSPDHRWIDTVVTAQADAPHARAALPPGAFEVVNAPELWPPGARD